MTPAEDHPCFYGCLICLERKTRRSDVTVRVLDRPHGEALAEDAARTPYCTGDRCGDCEAPAADDVDEECCEATCGCCPRVTEHALCRLRRGAEDDSKYCSQHGEGRLYPRSPEAERRYQILRGGERGRSPAPSLCHSPVTTGTPTPRGGTLHSLHPKGGTMHQPPHQVITRRGANHGLHIVLTILTCGIWAITGWPIAAAMGRKTRTLSYGPPVQQPPYYPPQPPPPPAGQYGPPRR